MNHSHWLDFAEDTGDCIGGVLVGYSIAKQELITGAIGVALILASIFLKHYIPKNEQS